MTAANRVTYAHDNRGNLAHDGIYTYTWNAAGRLVKAQSITHTVVYTYNGDDVRVGMAVDGAEAHFVQDIAGGLPQVLAETSGGQMTLYVYGVARLAQVKGSDGEWFLGDALGSVRQLAADDGAVVLARDYDPYGQLLSESGAGSSGYRFTGEQWDAYIDMLFLRARWYSPYLNRFVSPDTIIPDFANPQRLNRYTYALNNPTRYVDPSGHTIRSALDLIRKYREDIKSVADMYRIDPLVLAGVVFAENRNDYNWIRGQDWSGFPTLGLCGGPEVKNLLSPLIRFNPILGITEVSVAVAAMMDNRGLVPDDYGQMTWQERADLHEQIARNLAPRERQSIIRFLHDPKLSLMYSAKYCSAQIEVRETYHKEGESHPRSLTSECSFQ